MNLKDFNIKIIKYIIKIEFLKSLAFNIQFKIMQIYSIEEYYHLNQLKQPIYHLNSMLY